MINSYPSQHMRSMTTKYPATRSLLLAIPLMLQSAPAQTPQHQDYWNDPAITARIDRDIEKNRKSDATIRVIDAAGNPLPDVHVIVEQVDAEFHFGANIFMLGSYPTPELNRRYEEAFCKLFNAATVPFYWKSLEPEKGQPRFTADSPFIPRRPPVDVVVEFCEKHGLEMHGHPLVWKSEGWGVPEWLPNESKESIIPHFEEHVRRIAERYGDRIHRWDVVNEVIAKRRAKEVLTAVFPPDYDRLAFTWAERYLPADSKLYINETTQCWTGDLEEYTELIRELLDDNARIDGIGLQFHIFKEDGLPRVVAGELHKPGDLLAALDKYAQFGLPLFISEITLPSPSIDEQGQAIQAQVARSYYRLWFSHPAVTGITWWNFPDGGAVANEANLLSGILTEDLQPKAAYHALYDLIHREWRTNVQGRTNADGLFPVRGFHGKYNVRVEPAAISREFSISSGQSNELTIQVASNPES
jgi:endo-1,4-beta-xylanase